MTPLTDSSGVKFSPTSLNDWHCLFSWRSIFAGVALSVLFYLILLSIGVGIGGISMQDGVANAHDATVGTGLWIVLANALALFAGAFIATRSSVFSSKMIGMWQSAVIAAVFFVAVFMQVGALLGSAGRTLGALAGVASTSAIQVTTEAANSPMVQDIIETSLDQLNLKSPPETVVKGLTLRLMQGDGTSARDYLARQAGITPQDAQARIDTARQQVAAAYASARETAGKALSTAGWTLFIVMVAGLLSAMGGGYLGAVENIRHPVTDDEFLTRHRMAHV